MKYQFNDYAHDNYSRSETVEMLTTDYDWPEVVAEQYAEDHKPMYEVEAKFEYDSDTGELTVLSAVINGVKLVPAV